MPNPPTPRTSSRRHSRSTVPAGNALLLNALLIARASPGEVGRKKGNRTNVNALLVCRKPGTPRGQAMAFECVSRTDVGLRRKVNEDSILVRTERRLWAVADGMGGHEAGDVASGMVAEALQRLPVVYGLEQLGEAAIEE